MTDSCSAFFSIPVDRVSICLLLLGMTVSISGLSGNIVDETAASITAQQKATDSLAEAALDNCTAFDY